MRHLDEALPLGTGPMHNGRRRHSWIRPVVPGSRPVLTMPKMSSTPAATSTATRAGDRFPAG